MAIISLNKLGVTLGAPLFRNLDLVIGGGDRIGLVAGNGAGKSTLLSVLLGDTAPTEGAVAASRGTAVAAMPQTVPGALLGLSFRDAVIDALHPEARESEIWRANIVLDAIEAPEGQRGLEVSALSGGWQRLMLIARAWVRDPDVLLLDEPTNHLDLQKILLLERFLNETVRGTPLVIASHDRAFLDATTNRTLFLRPEISHVFALPYSRARLALDEADAAAEAQRGRELKEVDRLRKQAAKLTNVGINSGSDLLVVKSKQLRDRAEKIEAGLASLHKDRSGAIRLGNSGTHARVLLAVEQVSVETPDGRRLFGIDRLHMFQGDRIVLLGPNGAGKSRLMALLHRALTGEAVPGIRVTPSLRLGYADQQMAQLPPAETLHGFISTRFDVGDQRVRSLLAGAGFAVDRQERPISSLSEGQKSRLALLALRLAEPNFYLLDEPTNHIDIDGQEQLEREILAHEASCVLVSHDRAFSEAVATRWLEIRKHRLIEVDGPQAYYAALGARL